MPRHHASRTADRPHSSTLRPRAALDAFEAPDTGWRIARGALALLHPPAQTTTREQLTARVPAAGVLR